MGARKELHYQIADQNITVEVEASAAELLRGRHHDFLNPHLDSAGFRIVARASTKIADATNLDLPRLKRQGSTLRIYQSQLFALRVNLETKEGVLHYRPCTTDRVTGGPHGIRGALRNLLAFLLPQREGLLLHASAVITDQGCVAFVGPSGAGKTTLCSMFGEETIFNDEVIALTDIMSDARLHSTPFSGKLDTPRSRRSAPLSACFTLEKSPNTNIHALSPAQVFRGLSGCVLLPSGDQTLEKLAFDLTEKLSNRVSCACLSFRPKSAEVITTIKNYLAA